MECSYPAVLRALAADRQSLAEKVQSLESVGRLASEAQAQLAGAEALEREKWAEEFVDEISVDREVGDGSIWTATYDGGRAELDLACGGTLAACLDDGRRHRPDRGLELLPKAKLQTELVRLAALTIMEDCVVLADKVWTCRQKLPMLVVHQSGHFTMTVDGLEVRMWNPLQDWWAFGQIGEAMERRLNRLVVEMTPFGGSVAFVSAKGKFVREVAKVTDVPRYGTYAALTALGVEHPALETKSR